MSACIDELVSIPCPGGTIAGHLVYPDAGDPSCAALLVGAHPLLGGGMGNNVINALRAGLARRGAATLSFDYRLLNDPSSAAWTAMVSEFWATSHVAQETDWREDGAAAFAFLRDIAPVPTILIGYSFGCWVAAELSQRVSPASCVCISPNPREHDLRRLSRADQPLFVIHSDNDFSCTHAELCDWYDTLEGTKVRRCLPGAEHFFRGRESEVVATVVHYLQALGLLKD